MSDGWITLHLTVNCHRRMLQEMLWLLIAQVLVQEEEKRKSGYV